MAADAGSVCHRAGLLLILALPMTVHAAHPLISEDTATQGSGRFELEIGNAWTRDGSDRSYELGPQLSYGVLPRLDAILRPTWLDQRSTIDGGLSRSRRGRHRGRPEVAFFPARQAEPGGSRGRQRAYRRRRPRPGLRQADLSWAPGSQHRSGADRLAYEYWLHQKPRRSDGAPRSVSRFRGGGVDPQRGMARAIGGTRGRHQCR